MEHRTSLFSQCKSANALEKPTACILQQVQTKCPQPTLYPPCKSANAPGKGMLLEQRVLMMVTILTGPGISGDTPLQSLEAGWQLGIPRHVHQNPPYRPDSGGFLLDSGTYFLQMHNSNPYPCCHGDNLPTIIRTSITVA